MLIQSVEYKDETMYHLYYYWFGIITFSLLSISQKLSYLNLLNLDKNFNELCDCKLLR